MRTSVSRTSRLKNGSAEPTTGRGRLLLILYGTAVAAYLLDRVTKSVAERTLAGRPPIRLVPHVLDLRYTENSGGAFSLLGGQPWLFFTATVLVCLVIVAVSFRLTSARSAVGLGLVFGGALGNLTDRIARGPGVSGRVVDFIELHRWPVFNAADSAIVIGALLVVLAGLRHGERAPTEASSPGSDMAASRPYDE
jgi:signal peptidase II